MALKRVTITVLLTLLLFQAGCAKPVQNIPFESQKIKLAVGGSGVNKTMIKRLTEAYMERHPGVIIDIPSCLDFENTVDNVKNGNLDVGFADQALKASGPKDLDFTVYARTVVMFGVNPSVPVSGLSGRDIKAIYSGSVTNWKAVGGPDRELILLTEEYSESNKLSVNKYIKGFVDLKTPQNAVNVYNSLAMNGGIISIVDSIGLTDLGGIKADNLKIKSLELDGRFPSIENYLSGQYPLAKDLFLVSSKEPDSAVRDFIDFVLGWEGKKVIMENGYMVPGQLQ